MINDKHLFTTSFQPWASGKSEFAHTANAANNNQFNNSLPIERSMPPIAMFRIGAVRPGQARPHVSGTLLNGGDGDDSPQMDFLSFDLIGWH